MGGERLGVGRLEVEEERDEDGEIEEGKDVVVVVVKGGGDVGGPRGLAAAVVARW